MESRKHNFYDAYQNCPKSQPLKSDFKQLSVIGKGSYGEVHLILDAADKKYFALKCFEKLKLIRTKQVTNVLREKRLLSALDSPFIVKLLASYKDNSFVYFRMNFEGGGDLFFRLHRMGTFPLQWVKFYAAQVVLVLQYLNYLSVAYRDLKPENILICVDGYLKITDFGFAKIIPPNGRTYSFCGTPEYMAPEVIMNAGHTFYVDWWALGVLLYEMHTGHTPFKSASNTKTTQLILKNRVTYPESYDPVMKDLTTKLLQQDPACRLGCMANGTADVKKHAFFVNMDFEGLFAKNLEPPMIPKMRTENDLSNFNFLPITRSVIEDNDTFTAEFEAF